MDKPHPAWVYVVVFVLAGIPCLAIPFMALGKFIMSKRRKHSQSDAIKL